MRIINGFEHYFYEGAVVTVGSFDGVHSGHRRLITLLNEEAERGGHQAVVITFEPHPRQVLRGDNRLLSTIDEKLTLLEEAGARNVVVVEFNREFAALSGDTFARELLGKKLGTKVIFVGEGHSFGRDKGGTVEVLRECGFKVRGIERFDAISSTKVREAINSGDMTLANELLGAPYLVRTPLCNSTKLLPPEGEYLCSIDNKQKRITTQEIAALTIERTIRFLSNSVD